MNEFKFRSNALIILNGWKWLLVLEYVFDVEKSWWYSIVKHSIVISRMNIGVVNSNDVLKKNVGDDIELSWYWKGMDIHCVAQM